MPVADSSPSTQKSLLDATLGPIDPQLRGVPAYGVIEEFRTVAKEIKKDPSKIHVWNPILSKYYPAFLSQCKNAIDHSKEIAQSYLEEVMFKDVSNKKKIVNKIVEGLTDYSGNKSHSRHIHIEECRSLGLKVLELESNQELQELVLTVHHAFIHTFMNTPSFKIIENHLGCALIKTLVAPTSNFIQ